jgi:cellulose synthase/poly-beta-1,6-N-acetylglucosamine synthase-like glycosyltransferase
MVPARRAHADIRCNGNFDRETVIKAGGYSTKTVGEDMELVLRMRRYMAENDSKYEVTYIPDPLCWTEVPSDLKSLRKQRTRWTRGLVESLKTHRALFLNPRFHKLGLLGYPYWLFFEWLSPLIAFGGFVYTIILILQAESTGLFIYFFLYLFILLLFFSLPGQYCSKRSHFINSKEKRCFNELIATAFLNLSFIRYIHGDGKR